MTFIKNERPKSGDWVYTRKRHTCMAGTMTRGSRVKIIDIDQMRGYSIEDEDGNKLYEIGWYI